MSCQTWKRWVAKRDEWPKVISGQMRLVAKSDEWPELMIGQERDWLELMSGQKRWGAKIHEWPEDISDRKKWVTKSVNFQKQLVSKKDGWPRSGQRRWVSKVMSGQFDWYCFYYFVRNSLVALLEALCARKVMEPKAMSGQKRCMPKDNEGPNWWVPEWEEWPREKQWVPKRDAWSEEMIGRKRWVAKSVQMWWVTQTYEWPKELSGGQK